MKQALEYVAIGGADYETVAPSAAAQVLGTAGALNDLIARLIVTVTTSVTGTVDIKDGTNAAVNIVPANTPIGVYEINIGARSVSGAWQVTTGAGAQVLAVGQFSI